MKKILFIFLILGLCYAQTFETIFTDDFEDGNAYNWEAETGWGVVNDGGNYVFQCTGHKWAISPTEHYSNARFSGKFKLSGNSFHLNFLVSGTRHFFALGEENFDVYINDEFVESKTAAIGANTWHQFFVETNLDTIKISIDGTLLGEYAEPNGSNIKAKLAFESLDGATIQLDDILVQRAKPVYNQEAKWVKTGGPLGGIGYDVRIDPEDPNIIYVTDNWAGIHKSYDGGKSWVQKIDGIYSRSGPTNDAIPMFCLTIDPNDPEIVWAGTFGMRGIFKSVNKGESWVFSGNGVPNVENITTRSFAIEPGNSDVVYLGCEWSLYEEEAEALGVPSGTARGKVYRTSNGGLSWEEVLDCDALVRTIIIDPNNTSIVYAATGIFDRDHVAGSGIFKSTDAGANWNQINNGIGNLTVGDIEMHPDNSNILLAATGRLSGFSREPNSENGEILRTENGGETWTEVQVSFDDANGDDYTLFTYIEWDESDHNIIYAAASDRGFFKSTDGGNTFNPTAYNPPKINAGHIISVATHKDLPGQVFANSYGGGVFFSDNYTQSWIDASDGYTGNEVTDMTISSSDPEKVFLVSRTASFQTNDGGTHWFGNEASRQFSGVWLGDLEERSVAVHPANDDIIFTGGGDGIFRKEAGQEIFENVFSIGDYFNERPAAIQAIKFAPSDNSIIYAGSAIFGGYSIDRPETFDPTEAAFGMLKSTDGGKTWTPGLNSGLESSELNIMEIAVHPSNPDIVYIATLNNGFYKSTNGAANWAPIAAGITVKDTRSIAIDTNSPDVIYFGTQRGGIFKSTDGGATVTKLTNGIETEAAIRDIQIDPVNSDRVYAADWLSGVYVSDDAGASWRLINDELRTRAVQRLSVSSDGKYVYAGTQGEGVFRMTTINKGPVLRFISPDNSENLIFENNVDVEFMVSGYDFNGDELTAEWFLNDVKIDTASAQTITFNTGKLGYGNYKLKCVLSDAVNQDVEVVWNFSINIVSVIGEPVLSYRLASNYPNPFNPSTLIKYEIPVASNVKLEVFNVLGQKVATLVNKTQAAGNYTVNFDAANLASGVYIYRLTAGEFIKHRKMMLLK